MRYSPYVAHATSIRHPLPILSRSHRGLKEGLETKRGDNGERNTRVCIPTSIVVYCCLAHLSGNSRDAVVARAWMPISTTRTYDPVVNNLAWCGGKLWAGSAMNPPCVANLHTIQSLRRMRHGLTKRSEMKRVAKETRQHTKIPLLCI